MACAHDNLRTVDPNHPREFMRSTDERRLRSRPAAIPADRGALKNQCIQRKAAVSSLRFGGEPQFPAEKSVFWFTPEEPRKARKRRNGRP
jgi:hypothetical protein